MFMINLEIFLRGTVIQSLPGRNPVIKMVLNILSMLWYSAIWVGMALIKRGTS